MTDAAVLAVTGAAALAIVGALFGVGLARLIWADDLRHAQNLREIWTKTEAAQLEHIEVLKQQLKQRQ